MKIGIIGLGLIGGSILKALYNKGFDIYAVTRNLKTIENAQKYCNEISSDYEILKECEIVFVCTPMSKVLETLDKLDTILQPSAIVSDVSSLKEFVMKKKYSYNFVGSHPMAGTENTGFEYSFAELFENAKWVLTPHEETSQDTVKKLENVILKTGAKIIFADAKEHDIAVAKISHMPMLIAQAIYKSIENDKLALALASSGFRDMTRLAMSNVDMAEDMIELNNKNITNAVEKLYKSVENLQTDYKKQIIKISKNRAKMYDKNGKNTF